MSDTFYWFGRLYCDYCGNTWPAIVPSDYRFVHLPPCECPKCGEMGGHPIDKDDTLRFTMIEWVREFPRQLTASPNLLSVFNPFFIRNAFFPVDSVWFLPTGQPPVPVPLEPYKYRNSQLEMSVCVMN